MNTKIFFFGTTICAAMLFSCTTNKTTLPEPQVEETTTTTADTTGVDVTYTNDVKTIMDNNCVSCHGSSGGISLVTYAQVKTQADAGRILARAITGSQGNMPPSGLMDQATRDVLQNWINQGAQE
jgi:uncharacterized membrane protein